MKVLTAHIPLDLADEVDALAARLERSRAWIVKQALEAYLAKPPAGGFAEAPARFGHAPDAARGMNINGEIKMHRSIEAKDRAGAAHASLLALRATTTLGDVDWQTLRDAGRHDSARHDADQHEGQA